MVQCVPSIRRGRQQVEGSPPQALPGRPAAPIPVAWLRTALTWKEELASTSTAAEGSGGPLHHLG